MTYFFVTMTYQFYLCTPHIYKVLRACFLKTHRNIIPATFAQYQRPSLNGARLPFYLN